MGTNLFTLCRELRRRQRSERASYAQVLLLSPSLSLSVFLSACKMSTGVENEQLPRHCTLHANQNNNLKNTEKIALKLFAAKLLMHAVGYDSRYLVKMITFAAAAAGTKDAGALRIRAVCPQRMCRPQQNDPGILTKYFMHSFACRYIEVACRTNNCQRLGLSRRL